MEKITDLRKFDTKKLTETLEKKRHDLTDKKIMYTVGKTKDISIFSKLRKEIARIQTVIREKEILDSSVVNQSKGATNG